MAVLVRIISLAVPTMIFFLAVLGVMLSAVIRAMIMSMVVRVRIVFMAGLAMIISMAVLAMIHCVATGIGYFLYGGAGNDDIFGEGGHDVLIGGAGADTYWGGSGADSYHIDHTGKSGRDKIARNHFNQGDKIYVVVDQDTYDKIGTSSDPLELLGLTATTNTNTILSRDGVAVLEIAGYTTDLTFANFNIVLEGSAGDYVTGIVGNPDHVSNRENDLLILDESLGAGKAARQIEEIEFENSGTTFELAGVFGADGNQLDTQFEIRKITDADDNISYELWLSENAIIHYEASGDVMVAVIRELNAGRRCRRLSKRGDGRKSSYRDSRSDGDWCYEREYNHQ